MRETGMVIECEGRQHKFLLGLTDDGYRRECPICSKSLLQPRGAYSANEIYGMQTIVQAWREKRKESSDKRKPLSIEVDMDTNKMQLKLRAIAKHTEALADELKSIDAESIEEESSLISGLRGITVEINGDCKGE